MTTIRGKKHSLRVEDKKNGMKKEEGESKAKVES